MKKEGDRKICQECEIEIHVVKRTFQGVETLRWCNPDGSAHFYVDEETKQYVHTPTAKTKNDIWRQEIEERLARVEKQVGIIWYGE